MRRPASRRAVLPIAALAIAVAVVFGAIRLMAGDDTPRSDALFAQADRGTLRVARDIERGGVPGPADLSGVALDARHGEGITLLFHAMAAGNVEAAGALIRAGADLRITDRPDGTGRDAIGYLGMPGGPLLDADDLARLIAVYLEAGGDPNVRLAAGPSGGARQTLAARTAMMGNLKGFDRLIAAGADPWMGGDPATGAADLEAAVVMLGFLKHHDRIEALVDAGHFDARSPAELDLFFAALGQYAQRGDATSARIQEVALRVLARNPAYEGHGTDLGTGRIFKRHWNDPGTGTIPWDAIRARPDWAGPPP
ncbi:MAG: hypothetical protein ACU0CO_08975 [Shimia sp.]